MTAATLALVIAVAASLLAKETFGWLRRLSEVLVRRAIRDLPDDIPPAERARWEAEFLADLESFADRPIGCFFHALQVNRRGVRQLGGVLTSGDDSLVSLESQEELADAKLTKDPTSSVVEQYLRPAARFDRDSEVPLYFQLAAALKVMLEIESWEPGARFASEREIEEEFGVSRAVIRPALDLLVGDGAIFRIKGSGTFVAPPRNEVKVAGLARLWLDGANKHQVTILSVRKRRPDRLEAHKLELEDEQAPMAHVTAVMDVGRSTVTLIDSYSSVTRTPWLISIAEALKNGDKPPKPGKLKLTRAMVSVEHTFLGEWGASQLGAVAGEPALMAHIVQFGHPRGTSRERPLEYDRVIYRADATELTFDA
jgi:DNA-binding GntR family transcriptional regulator